MTARRSYPLYGGHGSGLSDVSGLQTDSYDYGAFGVTRRHSGRKSLQEVTQLIEGNGEKEIVDITLNSGEVIEATNNGQEILI